MIQLLSGAEIHRLCVVSPLRHHSAAGGTCSATSTTAVMYFVVYMVAFCRYSQVWRAPFFASKPIPGSEEEGRRG